MASGLFTLIAPDGTRYVSTIKGTIGGHRSDKIFGRLDCPAALRAIARGGYVSQRVFFVDAETAVRAGYRPCAACLPDAYREWKASTETSRQHGAPR
jgi:methylphosphotriester-DNA--protein-cysteine methyltransferase